MRRAAVALLAVLVAGCAPPDEPLPPLPPPTPEPLVVEGPEEPDVPPAPQIDIELTGQQVGLTRTACLGSCPDYTVTVDAHGHVKLAGGGLIVREGTEMRRIEPSAARRLFALADSLRFGELPPSIDAWCASNPTDLPGTVVAVQGTDGAGRSQMRSCWTLAQLITLEDSVVVGRRTVSQGAFSTAPALQGWARQREDAFVRANYLRSVARGGIASSLPAGVLRRDSLARSYVRRLTALASTIDADTGAEAWADGRSRPLRRGR